MNKNIPNTYRFFEVPKVKSKYTYICDIDIMLLEEILPNYLSNWPKNLPYSNILRSDTNRLTGVILTITEQFFNDKYTECQKKLYESNNPNNDEHILKMMCEAVHGLPPKNFSYRPILGIHFSPNRGENKSMDLKTNKKYFDIFKKVVDKYPELFNYKIFNNLLFQLNNNFMVT